MLGSRRRWPSRNGSNLCARSGQESHRQATTAQWLRCCDRRRLRPSRMPRLLRGHQPSRASYPLCHRCPPRMAERKTVHASAESPVRSLPEKFVLSSSLTQRAASGNTANSTSMYPRAVRWAPRGCGLSRGKARSRGSGDDCLHLCSISSPCTVSTASEPTRRLKCCQEVMHEFGFAVKFANASTHSVALMIFDSHSEENIAKIKNSSRPSLRFQRVIQTNQPSDSGSLAQRWRKSRIRPLRCLPDRPVPASSVYWQSPTPDPPHSRA